MEIYTVGPYYAHFPRGRWTQLLKHVKLQFRSDLLKPMAEVMATFILDQTALLEYVDILIPIPPSPEKFGERGFAPNDIVADYLGERLALPVRNVLVRKPGLATREATRQELAAQFEVKPAQGAKLKDLAILLVEDIWTWGRTIPICAETLRQYGPKAVFAVALGKTQ
jgi:predicted amidophosphoribosyltransferase